MHATAMTTLVVAMMVCAPLTLAATASPSAETKPAQPSTDSAAAVKSEAAADTTTSKPSDFESEKLDPTAFEEEEKASKGEGKKESTSGGAMWRMVLGLLFVLGVIYAVHWLLKNYNKSKFSGVAASGAGAIEVVATTPLAANRMLHLVRIGKEMVLIGATDASITQLGTVDTNELVFAAGDAGNSDFQQMLHGAISGQQATPASDTFMRRFVSNLQMLTAR